MIADASVLQIEPSGGKPFRFTNFLNAWKTKPLGSKLEPGVVFSHQYDFGSTTKLALRVEDELTAPALPGGLKPLTRNEPLAIPCSV